VDARDKFTAGPATSGRTRLSGNDEYGPAKNHPSAPCFQKKHSALSALFIGENSAPFDFAAAMAITAPISLLKDAIREGTP
jgi:hypothetical protein